MNLGHDTVTWCTWVMAAGRNFSFKIVAKPLQVETRLLLTACRNLRLTCFSLFSQLTVNCLLYHRLFYFELYFIAFTRDRSIQWYHRRPRMTYGLATIHALQTTTTDDRQMTHCAKNSTWWSVKNWLLHMVVIISASDSAYFYAFLRCTVCLSVCHFFCFFSL